ncbi:MAG: amidohydrolase [Bacteroidota bacterium]|nr:amidohydrolase [Bacteroidota bacterium]
MKNLIVILLLVPVVCFGQELNNKIENLITKYNRENQLNREWFHKHAELSNREFLTAERIAQKLKEIGLRPKVGVAKTGVVAILNENKPGPVIALRADIDGLPVKERNDLPWASKMTGEYNGEEVPVMHACGHDIHIAVLLGTAKILTEMKDEINGSVKFIFPPAEEGPPRGEEGGAELMVKEGVLKNPDVDVIFGLHVTARANVGEVQSRPGAIMAAVDEFRIDLFGKQTHGSRPWKGIDPIITASQIINGLQTIVSRNLPLTKAAAVVTIGAIHGGVRSNIIPENLYMLGTIRTLDSVMRDTTLQRVKEMIDYIAAANNTEVKISFGTSYPITFNDPSLFEKMLPTLKRINGQMNFSIIDASTGAEDFSFFQEKVPGLYFYIGGTPKHTDPKTVADHHTPDFYVDSASIPVGIRSMTNLTFDYIRDFYADINQN